MYGGSQSTPKVRARVGSNASNLGRERLFERESKNTTNQITVDDIDWGHWATPPYRTDVIKYRKTEIFHPLDPIHPTFHKQIPNQDPGNVALHFKIGNISNMNESQHTVDVEFECVTEWQPALPEFRAFDEDKNVCYLFHPRVFALLIEFED